MKIDLHTHSYYSKDGSSSPEKLIKMALKKGLDGIALTDHDTIAGWKEATIAAKKLNAVLILGEEIKTKRNGKIVGDILGLFLKEEIKSKEPFQVIKEIHSQNGIAIIAHPFHFLENFKDDLKKYKDLIDGIEVFNARQPFSFLDKKAFEFAKKYNLAMTAGSDAHFWREAGDAYTIVQDAKSLEEFKKAIFEKRTKTKGKKSPLYYLIFPTLAKTGLIGRPPGNI